MSVDPEDRFSTAELFVDALREAATRTAVEEEERRRRVRHNRRRAGVGVAVGAVALAGWWLTRAVARPAMERGARYRARAEEMDPDLASRDGGVRA